MLTQKVLSIIFWKNLKFTLLVMLTILLSGCYSSKVNVVISPEYKKNIHIRVAILDFDFKAGKDVSSLFYGAGSSKNAGKMIADLLTEEIMSIPGVVVVERSKLIKILEEKQLSISGLLESDKLAEVAELAGIDTLVVGSVGDASAVNILVVLQESVVAFQARCIRVSDGVVLWAGSIVAGAGSHNVTKTLNEAAKDFGKELKKKLK